MKSTTNFKACKPSNVVVIVWSLLNPKSLQGMYIYNTQRKPKSETETFIGNATIWSPSTCSVQIDQCNFIDKLIYTAHKYSIGLTSQNLKSKKLSPTAVSYRLAISSYACISSKGSKIHIIFLTFSPTLVIGLHSFIPEIGFKFIQYSICKRNMMPLSETRFLSIVLRLLSAAAMRHSHPRLT